LCGVFGGGVVVARGLALILNLNTYNMGCLPQCGLVQGRGDRDVPQHMCGEEKPRGLVMRDGI